MLLERQGREGVGHQDGSLGITYFRIVSAMG